jgi:hypothetical protein
MFKIKNFLVGLVKSIINHKRQRISLDKALQLGFVTIEALKKDGSLSVKNAIKKADYLKQQNALPQGVKESPTHLLTFYSENEGWRSFLKENVLHAEFTSERLQKKYEIEIK